VNSEGRVRWSRVVVIACALLAVSAPSHDAEAKRESRSSERSLDADEAEPISEASPTSRPADDETPWSKGVSLDARLAAQRLLEEGNALFLEGQHRDALARYQEAIASWDHPAIRFNIVRALILLDRPVEAFENLEQALRFGSAPLEDTVYAEAQNYHRLLRGQIAEIEVRCSQAGVRVTVDGQEFTSCPGSRSARILPGSHQIVAKKDGHLTLTEDVVVLPAQREEVDVALQTLTEAAVTERRWKPAMPWLVTAGGALVAGAGALLQLRAKADLNQYSEDISRICASGCQPDEIPAGTANLASRGEAMNRAAIATMAAGGAIGVTGIILLVMNRQRTVIPDEQHAAPRTEVGGAVAPGHFALSLRHSF
jgi:tetratricopeptide (TPR) repeat protein